MDIEEIVTKEDLEKLLKNENVSLTKIIKIASYALSDLSRENIEIIKLIINCENIDPRITYYMARNEVVMKVPEIAKLIKGKLLMFLKNEETNFGTIEGILSAALSNCILSDLSKENIEIIELAIKHKFISFCRINSIAKKRNLMKIPEIARIIKEKSIILLKNEKTNSEEIEEISSNALSDLSKENIEIIKLAMNHKNISIDTIASVVKNEILMENLEIAKAVKERLKNIDQEDDIKSYVKKLEERKKVQNNTTLAMFK